MGRKKKYQDCDFSHLNLFKDEELLEEKVEDFISGREQRSYFEGEFDNIYDLYIDEFGPKKISFDLETFKSLLFHEMEHYTPFEEISFYHFLKRKIDQEFNLRNSKLYFSSEQEGAFRKFIKETNIDRKNILYNNFLKQPIEKMVESIIRKYNLHLKNTSYEDLHNSVVGFLHDKMGLFDPDRGTKAYSYLGTIAVRRLKYLQEKEQENITKVISFQDVFNNEQEEQFYFQKIYEDNLNVSFFQDIQDIISDYIKTEEKRELLTENDIKVAYAIIEILDKWEDIFEPSDTTKKFKKNAVFAVLRNLTLLETKYITQSLKIFREIYTKEKKKKIEREYNPMEDIF
jgi:hypothetical protein